MVAAASSYKTPMPKSPRQRADQLVFEQGLAESREQARRLIMAGKIILE